MVNGKKLQKALQPTQKIIVRRSYQRATFPAHFLQEKALRTYKFSMKILYDEKKVN